MPDELDYEAVVHGPIVLAAIIDTTDMPGLLADDSRMGHVAQGRQLPLKDMPFFVNGKNDDTTFIRQVPDSH
ncbi:DUF4986 domain-containing protein [Mucilaginibacter sp. SMC90]|uniref:DUF4986 domain-containing protein n=1 Tax=Mucilaginibacter sp. SMC90 TaxID=2929803 RepID=UPI00211172EA|nr:DUF4986 domain-containing protein [Mucilaginibacter sp. SMC90]